MNSTTHWDAVYAARATEDLGWYEPRPSTLGLVLRFSEPSDAVIDIGSGDSRTADELVHAGYADITILDLSRTALDRVRSRLGPAAREVTSIEADVTLWQPPRHWDLWHDRAVFHFLVDADGRDAYKATALRALAGDGRLVIATFAVDGPEQCADLPVERYDHESLAAFFEPEFRLVEHRDMRAEPAGAGDTRPYVAAVLERR
ncbi:MAG: class I SAM-dependent methyltransferase [Acidimicrobiales bacterium]